MTAIGSGDLLGARNALTQFDDLLATNAEEQAKLADAIASGNITEEQLKDELPTNYLIQDVL